TTSCKPFFKTKKIPTFYALLTLEACTTIHKIQDNLQKHEDVHHTHNTRNKRNIITSKNKSFKNSFLNEGIKIYNLLPGYVKDLNLQDFKASLKTHLLENPPYSLLDCLNTIKQL
ncbi:hypothetical protein WDU94_012289, partial [Cyamophila willieti]